MTYTYTEFLNPITEEVVSITRSDGASIPIDPSNADYQRYLNPEADNPVGGN
jgi:hypothetical protein